MKTLSIVLLSFVALSTSVQASQELINQPAVTESPKHYDMHDLKHWMLGYPQVNFNLANGTATLTGHVESQLDGVIIVRQVEKTAGVRRVTNLITYD